MSVQVHIHFLEHNIPSDVVGRCDRKNLNQKKKHTKSVLSNSADGKANTAINSPQNTTRHWIAVILPRKRTRFGECGFFYSGPATWNTLPSNLHDITDTSTFRKRLKNVLFDRAFNWFCWRSWTCRIAAPYKFCVDRLIDLSRLCHA